MRVVHFRVAYLIAYAIWVLYFVFLVLTDPAADRNPTAILLAVVVPGLSYGVVQGDSMG